MNETTTTQPQSSGFFTLLLGAIIYSAIGLAAGLCWTYAATAMSIPGIGLLPFLALWWAWLFVWMPPIVVGVSVLRATDPLAQVAQNMNKNAQGPNT